VEAKEEEEEEKRQTEWAHKEQVNEVKAKVLGNLASQLEAMSDKKPSTALHAEGPSVASSNKKGGTPALSGKTLETLDTVIAGMAKTFDEMKKCKAEASLKREEHKLLEAENQKKELDNKKKDLELQKQQFELMMKHS